MSRKLGFRVDLKSCIGCKACQVACKDKHQLAEGILWRRVVEVAGGAWTRPGETWQDDTYSYFVSVACMHCEQPICAEVCPTRAMSRDSKNGIVAIDADRCIGCRYCEWVCPYAAPQYDPVARVMTKCDLCRDELAAGRPPACVAACPMRVIEVVDFAKEPGTNRAPFPLPPAHLTEPSTDLPPHRDVERAQGDGPRIANEEEI